MGSGCCNCSTCGSANHRKNSQYTIQEEEGTSFKLTEKEEELDLSSDKSDPKLNILHRLESVFLRSEVSSKINDIQQRITNTKTQRVILQKENERMLQRTHGDKISLRTDGCDDYNNDDHWKDAHADQETTITTLSEVKDYVMNSMMRKKNSRK